MSGPFIALIVILILAVLYGWFRAVRAIYYFRGRLDEVEAIAGAVAPEELVVDPGIYRARVLHQTRNAVGLNLAERYVKGQI